MSEKQTVQSASPVAELGNLLGQTNESDPASIDQFRGLKAAFDGIIADNDAGAIAGKYDAISMSTFLRREGEPDDAPRFRVTSDPKGELFAGTNYGGSPTVMLRIEQGQKGEGYPGKGKVGSWAAELYLMENGDQVRAVMKGTQKTGRRKGSTEQVPGASIHGYRASEELLQWVESYVGDPESFVPAPTKVEKSAARWAGIITGRQV